MTAAATVKRGFRAAPVIDYQLFITTEMPWTSPTATASMQQDGLWLASDKRLPWIPLQDAAGRGLGLLIGLVYSADAGAFLPEATHVLAYEVTSAEDLERRVLPDLAGMFVLFSGGGALPSRLYMDHGGCLPTVFSPEDRRAATSPALLLADDAAYAARFWDEIHEAMIRKEPGGWISGTLTAHRGVSSASCQTTISTSPNLDRPLLGRGRGSSTAGATLSQRRRRGPALTRYVETASKAFDVTVTLTAGFDTRLLVASCHTSLERVQFFT